MIRTVLPDRGVGGAALAWVAALVLLSPVGVEGQAQLSYQRGQNVSPAYEGWEQNEDGSFSFLFGYMNRNWEEEIDVPIGPDNHFHPGLEDQGQPTRFLPRRNRFTFKVRVPADWGDRELIWALTTNGVTEYAYASLREDYLVDNVVIASETGSLGAGTSSPETRSNQSPVIELEGPGERTVRVGEPLTLVTKVTDDGIPRPRRAQLVASGIGEEGGQLTPEQMLQRALRPPTRVTVGKTVGLHYAWFVYRGEGGVTFDPIQVKTWEDTRAAANSPWAPLWVAPPIPEDGRWIVRATFDTPGTYVLRGRADDGGLYADTQVTVRVTP
jgi:hypothetical protein